MKFSFPLLLIMLVFISSCKFSNDRLKVDVSDVKTEKVKIHRYDLDLFKVNIENLSADLKKIQAEYPFFLATDLDDPSNLNSMKDYLENPRNIEFATAVAEKFGDLSKYENDLSDAFRHVKYYFPQFKIPRVYTFISGGDYDNPVSLVDSVLLIAIDTYMGKDFKPYQADGIPLYKTERMIPEQIVPDCMREVVNMVLQHDPSRLLLLEQITEAGKSRYLLQAFIPDLPGDLLMKYPKDQFEWVKKNEKHVWAAIIQNRMLYSTEGKTMRTFLADGPFTQEFSKASPPRLGEWIGLQIIRSYMNKNSEIELVEMLKEKDAQKMLQHSGYKPEK